MRTVKIMFLLVRIFNEEKLAIPKRIKYNKHIYEYEEEIYDWTYYKDGKVKYLMSDVFNNIDNVSDILNSEVEIVEDEQKEDKKIKFSSKTYNLDKFGIDYPDAAKLLIDTAMKAVNK